jgi:hypothetical protein
MFKNSFRWIMIITIIIVCIMASNGYCIDPNTSLETNLVRITSQNKGRGTDVQKLEGNCLELLRDHNTPEDKGKIYAKIAFMYSGKGYSSPNDVRIAKTAEYCRKALEYPLDTLTTCETYASLTGAQIAPYYKRPVEEFTKARKEAIVTCLTGLKLVLDNNAPKEWVNPPGVDMYTVHPNSPNYKKVVKEHERQMEARNKWEVEKKLYILRGAAIESCVTLYSAEPPYDMNELEKFTHDILKGHDDAVDEIMTKARERIPQQGDK